KQPQLLLLRKGGALRLLDLETGTVAATGLSLAAGYRAADWHPDGHLLALSGMDSKIYLWDTAASRLVLPPLEGHRSGAVILRLAPSGARLLSTDWSEVWRLWDTRTGRQLLSMPAGGTCLQFAAGEQFLAAETHPLRARLFRYCSGREFRTLVLRDAA